MWNLTLTQTNIVNSVFTLKTLSSFLDAFSLTSYSSRFSMFQSFVKVQCSGWGSRRWRPAIGGRPKLLLLEDPGPTLTGRTAIESAPLLRATPVLITILLSTIRRPMYNSAARRGMPGRYSKKARAQCVHRGWIVTYKHGNNSRCDINKLITDYNDHQTRTGYFAHKAT